MKTRSKKGVALLLAFVMLLTMGMVFPAKSVKADGQVVIELKGKVMLEGAELQEGQFWFEATRANSTSSIDPVSNDESGDIVFREIIDNPYAGWEGVYTIKQVYTDNNDIIYDTNEKTITAMLVEESPGVLNLIITDEFMFLNEVAPTPLMPTSFLLPGEIKLEGKESIPDKAFHFEIREKGEVVAEGTNDTGGDIRFDEIEYKEKGKHYYEITQVIPKGAIEVEDGWLYQGVLYDKSVKTVYVDVKEGDVKYEASIVKDESDEIQFTNVYGMRVYITRYDAVYDGWPQAASYIITDGEPVETTSDTKYEQKIDGVWKPVAEAKNVGLYRATVTADATANYSAVTVSKEFTIKPRDVNIEIKGVIEKTKYNGKTITVTGLSNVKITTVGLGNDSIGQYDFKDTTVDGKDPFEVFKVTGTNAGTYTQVVDAARFVNNNANYNVSYTATNGKLTISKATPSVKITSASKTASAKTLKKKAVYTSALSVSGAKGTKTFTKTGGSAKLTIGKTNGKIKIKKGTKKGTYSIKVKVTSAATKNYNAKTSAVKTVKVKVK